MHSRIVPQSVTKDHVIVGDQSLHGECIRDNLRSRTVLIASMNVDGGHLQSRELFAITPSPGARDFRAVPGPCFHSGNTNLTLIDAIIVPV
jgi:hypothetical protein